MFRHFPAYALVGASLAMTIPSVQAAMHVKSHDGVVVSVAQGKLIMTDKDGKNEHTHAIDNTVKVTLNGNPAKITDLVTGDMVRIGVNGGNQIISVAAMRVAR